MIVDLLADFSLKDNFDNLWKEIEQPISLVKASLDTNMTFTVYGLERMMKFSCALLPDCEY